MANEIGIIPNIWRESARGLRFFFMPAGVAAPVAMFMLHIRWWTFGVLVMTIVLMILLDRRGYTSSVALLALRARIAGRRVNRRCRTGNRYI